MRLPNAFLLILVCLCSIGAYAQHLSTAELIRAWRADGKDQTQKAEMTFEDLAHNLDAKVFQLKIDSLYDYLKGHESTRLWIRTVMYEVYGNRKLENPFQPIYVTEIKKAITLAGLQGDKQLLSELYTHYADNYVNGDMQNRLFYILKAMEMQRKIGFEYFPHVYLRFVSISKAMYQTMDYRQAIHYGIECLALMNSPNTNINNYILQLDLIGASYKNLGLVDSSSYYYHQIQDILDRYPTTDPSFKEIWRGVATGGIAQALFLKGDFTKAYQLLLQNLTVSRQYKQCSDASMAANTLAKINFVHHNYDSALYYWEVAYTWAAKSEDLVNIVQAAKGLSDTYLKMDKVDSSFFYLDKFHTNKDSLQRQMNDCRLSTLTAQVEYDDMQAALVRAQKTIGRQHQMRNITLSCIVILGIIAIFLYNRYRLKQELHRQILERKNKLVAMEVARAKDQITQFTVNLKEKERLIDQLQRQLPEATSKDAFIAERLKQYSLVTDEAWVKFKGEFMTAYPDFYPRLYKVLHKMTPAEERLTALIYLRLSNQLMATTLGISKDSVLRSKHRLNLKMALPPDVSLENYVLANDGLT